MSNKLPPPKYDPCVIKYKGNTKEYIGCYYISMNSSGIDYLHHDGVVRISTKYNGMSTGYFDDKESAEAVLQDYLDKQ